MDIRINENLEEVLQALVFLSLWYKDIFLLLVCPH